MSNPELEQALHDLEVTANNFAARLVRMAMVRQEYVEQIAEMSRSIRASVEAGEISAARGAEVAHQMRNEIMEMQRLRDMDLGRALAQKWKKEGLTLEASIEKAMAKKGFAGRRFNELADAEQRAVYVEVVESAGRSRAKVTAGIPRLRWTGRALWIATLLIAGYNIGTAENPWWQTGREAANIGGGFAGGAATGALVGMWAGPVGVGIGVVVGGILGALLADHAYVEAAGTSDPATRAFVGRFTSFWTGVDEAGIARALASEHVNNPEFVARVFLSLDHDYSTDADDVAVEYVKLAQRTPAVAAMLRKTASLRQLLIRLMDEGWTSGEEKAAIGYLKFMQP